MNSIMDEYIRQQIEMKIITDDAQDLIKYSNIIKLLQTLQRSDEVSSFALSDYLQVSLNDVIDFTHGFLVNSGYISIIKGERPLEERYFLTNKGRLLIEQLPKHQTYKRHK